MSPEKNDPTTQKLKKNQMRKVQKYAKPNIFVPSFTLNLKTYKFTKIIFLEKNLYLLITKDATQYLQSAILFVSNLTSKYYKSF